MEEVEGVAATGTTTTTAGPTTITTTTTPHAIPPLTNTALATSNPSLYGLDSIGASLDVHLCEEAVLTPVTGGSSSHDERGDVLGPTVVRKSIVKKVEDCRPPVMTSTTRQKRAPTDGLPYHGVVSYHISQDEKGGLGVLVVGSASSSSSIRSSSLK